MKFNEFFDLANDLSDVDSENFNNAEIKMDNDMDFGSCLSYSLDPTYINDEEYIRNIEALMESYSISDFKIEDDTLIFVLS